MHIIGSKSMPINEANRKKIAKIFKKHQKDILQAFYTNQFKDEFLIKYEINWIPHLNPDWLCKHFLKPLIVLIIKYLETGNSDYLDVYLDERLRYAPYQTSLENRQVYFRELLSDELNSIINNVKVNDRTKSEIYKVWELIHSSLLEKTDAPKVTMLAVGDCLLNELRVFLPKSCRDEEVRLDMRFLYFSAPQNTDLSSSQVLEYVTNNPIELIALSFLSYRGLPSYALLMENSDKLNDSEIAIHINGLIRYVQDFIEALRKHTDIPIFLHNTCGLPLSTIRKYIPILPPFSSKQKQILLKLNSEMSELANNYANIMLIDEDKLAELKGYKKLAQNVFPKHLFLHALFHTSSLAKHLVRQYINKIVAYSFLRKIKALLIDFDNTLWEGIMADGLVRHKHNVQMLLKNLMKGGILLVAVSKNDPKNIRWEEMTLNPSDFVSLKISWNLKVQSIEEVAEELNLGIDSFLFIDDNPVERELVQSQFSEVKTIDPLDPSSWEMIQLLQYFPNTSTTKEAFQRTEMYRAQANRKAACKKEYDYPSLMKMLGLKVRFSLAKKKHLPRITELVARTNQFNTTTIRYSRTDLKKILENDDYKTYVFELSDKFGDLGIVGVVIINHDNDVSVFNSFIMSCRAMGFGLENLMLNLVVESEKNAKQFIGIFVPTDRNMPSKDIYSNNGFKQISEDKWLLKKLDNRPDVPTWFQII